MRAFSRLVFVTLSLPVALLGTINCGKTASDPEANGDGDGDIAGDGDGETGGRSGSGASSSGGNGGSGGAGTSTGGHLNSPVTDECWFQSYLVCVSEEKGLGGAGEDCPLTQDIEVICSVHGFNDHPVVMPNEDGAGVQFVSNMRFKDADADRHGQLNSDGTVTLTDLRDGPRMDFSRFFVAGFDPNTYAIDLVEEKDELVSVSHPYLPSDGTPTWAPAVQDAAFLRSYARAPDGTVHLFSSTNDFGEAYVVGTAQSGMSPATPIRDDIPYITTFTESSKPVITFSTEAAGGGFDINARVSGSSAQVVTTFNSAPFFVSGVTGAVDAPSSDDYLILAAGDGALRVVADPAMGLDAVELPIDFRRSGDCSPEGCNGTCEFVGDIVTAESATRTSDGRIWVAAQVVHEDTRIAYSVLSSEDAYICGAEYERDASTWQVVLYEVDLQTSTATLVFASDMHGPAPTDRNLMNWSNYYESRIQLVPSGRELLLTVPRLQNDRGRDHFRTLRVDTTRIP